MTKDVRIEIWCEYGVLVETRDAAPEEAARLGQAISAVRRKFRWSLWSLLFGVVAMVVSTAVALRNIQEWYGVACEIATFLLLVVVAVSLVSLATYWPRWLRLKKERPPFRMEVYGISEEVKRHADDVSECLASLTRPADGGAEEEEEEEAEEESSPMIVAAKSGLVLESLEYKITGMIFATRWRVPFPVSFSTDDVESVEVTLTHDRTQESFTASLPVVKRSLCEEERKLFVEMRSRAVRIVVGSIGFCLLALWTIWTPKESIELLVPLGQTVVLTLIFAPIVYGFLSQEATLREALRRGWMLTAIMPGRTVESMKGGWSTSGRAILAEYLTEDVPWRTGPFPVYLVENVAHRAWGTSPEEDE
jgi:hypothetical protein